jgi:hypothetical protein
VYFKKVTEFIKKIAHFLRELNASLFSFFSYKIIKRHTDLFQIQIEAGILVCETQVVDFLKFCLAFPEFMNFSTLH